MRFFQKLFVNFQASIKMMAILWKVDKKYLIYVLFDI